MVQSVATVVTSAMRRVIRREATGGIASAVYVLHVQPRPVCGPPIFSLSVLLSICFMIKAAKPARPKPFLIHPNAPSLSLSRCHFLLCNALISRIFSYLYYLAKVAYAACVQSIITHLSILTHPLSHGPTPTISNVYLQRLLFPLFSHQGCLSGASKALQIAPLHTVCLMVPLRMCISSDVALRNISPRLPKGPVRCHRQCNSISLYTATLLLSIMHHIDVFRLCSSPYYPIKAA